MRAARYAPSGKHRLSSLPILRELLPRITIPVQVLFGERDPIVSPARAEILGRSLPHVGLVGLDAEHFAWEDAAVEYAAALRGWVDGSYREV